MIRQLLVRHFVRNPDDVARAETRQQYGRLSSLVGIAVNLLLFAAKFTAGTLFGSIAVTGDAFNNLSDAASSVISLVSFRLAAKPADKGHPFGHARIEYVASAIVSILILLIGIELLRTSVEKILHPDPIEFSLFTLAVLAGSIAFKLWLYRFNRTLGRLTDSSIMLATAADSLSDVLATSAVLASMLLSPLLGIPLDGVIGAAVSILILLSGYRIFKSTLDRILGQGPTEETVQLIDDYIHRYDGVKGIHDLVVHDYGPFRSYASVHVEVDATVDIMISHDLIDNIEHDILREHGINLVIHLDPVIRDDPYVNQLYQLVKRVVHETDASLTFHDFRVVRGQSHSNLIFDVTVPFECRLQEAELIEAIQSGLAAENPDLRAVVNIDRSYV